MNGASVSVSTWKFVTHKPAFQIPVSIPGGRKKTIQNSLKRIPVDSCKIQSGPYPFGIVERVTAYSRLNVQVQGRLATSRRRPSGITFLGRSDESRNLGRLVTRVTDEDDKGAGLEEGHVEIDNPSRGAHLGGTVRRVQTAVQIFIAAFVWLAFFFGASAWDGKGRKK